MDETQDEIKIARKSINNLRYANDNTLMAETEEELESTDEGERREWKSQLKTQHSKMNIMAFSPITAWQICGETMGKWWQTSYSWTPKSLQMVTTIMKLKDACSLEESYDKPRQHFKKQRHYFANKVSSSQSYSFSSSHVQRWQMDHKESWEAKNSCFWTVDL